MLADRGVVCSNAPVGTRARSVARTPRRAERPVPGSSRRDSMSTIRSTTPSAKPVGNSTAAAAKPAAQATPRGVQATQVTSERIAKRAYEKWLKRGCTHGNDVQDWVEAEKEVMAELMGSTPAASGTTRR